MKKRIALLLAGLAPASVIFAGVTALPANAVSCSIQDDRKQAWGGVSWNTVAYGKKVTCASGTPGRYAIVITCDPNNGDNYTRHGATVTAPNKSSVLCNDARAFDYLDKVVDYYIRWY